MKNLKVLLSAIVLSLAFGAQAQVETKKTTTTTTTTLPEWGVAGSNDARYYYIPDIETYYDVKNKNFVYMKDGTWAKTTELPDTYKDYDLYSGYKVVLDDEAEPYGDYDKMKVKYNKGFKGEPQKTVKIKKRKNGTVKIKETD
ncbi:hypothetical protein [Flavobacterium sp. GT3R68]|uniref:hypothetical protein n=1 Tax=Flavobacterium sp. GT3R68 TaxID=2594437 RepID=UPI000F897250|nr:hypothetical protein [Flavobacterium sp. GT3R68]RTY89133.1 hypothetical protein EKL32_24230 [Flavobacterium sp. GSN2]TRW90069.1 hypothetical protein FNW07_11460 [Flavobacterium sp. GT3R68]